MVLENPTKQMIETVKHYAQPLIDANCDTVVMGCTHFPVMEPLFKRVMGGRFNFVSPSKKTAEELSNMLENFDIANSGKASYKFFTTGNDYTGMQHL